MPLVALVEATLTTIICHDYIHKGHNFRFSETHGRFTKCHMSQCFYKPHIYNKILPCASLLT